VSRVPFALLCFTRDRRSQLTGSSGMDRDKDTGNTRTVEDMDKDNKAERLVWVAAWERNPLK
jgi:hypothetical protein